MNKIGIMIRKMDLQENGKKLNPTSKNLHKQIKTLHSKLKKHDTDITTTYVIEKDNSKKFHTHLLINYNNEKNLYNQLSRFIGGNSWEERKDGLDTINGCNGKYGEVDTHFIYDEVEFLNYLNKTEQTETLV